MYSNIGKALVSLGLIALTGWVFYLTGSIWSFLIIGLVEFPEENENRYGKEKEDEE